MLKVIWFVLVDRDGVALVIRVGAVHRNDPLETLSTVVSYSAVEGTVGRPPTHSAKLYADAGHACEAARNILRWLGNEPYIRNRRESRGTQGGASALGRRTHQLFQPQEVEFSGAVLVSHSPQSRQIC